MTEDTTKTLQQLLWDAELILRRQLQAVDEAAISPGSNIDSPPHIDPNIYTHTQAQSEEDLSQSRGRTVLTILYLCVLGLCFVVPVFYYFRLHCFEENARRELELDFTTALEQSEQHREESRAARRKYIEERRARIVQLLGPVRMVSEKTVKLIATCSCTAKLTVFKKLTCFCTLFVLPDVEGSKFPPFDRPRCSTQTDWQLFESKV